MFLARITRLSLRDTAICAAGRVFIYKAVLIRAYYLITP